MRRLTSLIYLLLGVVIAAQHHYYAHLDMLAQVASAVAATALWPLVLLGANLHLHLLGG